MCTAFLFVASHCEHESPEIAPVLFCSTLIHPPPVCLCTHMRVIKQRSSWSHCNQLLLLLWKKKCHYFPLLTCFLTRTVKAGFPHLFRERAQSSRAVNVLYFCPTLVWELQCVATDTSSQTVCVLSFFTQTYVSQLWHDCLLHKKHETSLIFQEHMHVLLK